MKKLLLATVVAATAFSVSAADGKWTPWQITEIDAAWLKQQGLEVEPGKLWNPATGEGLLSASVQVGGCTGGFISETGLFITNHHCLFGTLQQHSSPERDLIRDGFLARSRGEELAGRSTRLTIPRKFTDVTADVLAAVPKKADDLQRFRSIEAREKELVARCETQPNTRCKIGRFDGGLQFVLMEMTELTDVRLVYAPPRAVGEYGGEVDNWMWPRHTGDFAIGRAYVSADGRPAAYAASNVPYRPRFHYPISAKGVSPGDFVMVMGYPGTTYRSLTAAEMRERRDLFFTRRAEIYGEWIDILESASKGDAAGAIAVADNLKTFYNRVKNAKGQLEGFARHDIVERVEAEEKAILAWAAARPEHAGAVAAHKALAGVMAEKMKTWERDYLLSLVAPLSGSPVPVGAKSLYFATTVVRSAIERQKPDASRETLYMERDLPRVAERMDREQKNVFLPADKRLFTSFVRRALALPANQRIAAVDRLFGSEKNLDAAVEKMYASSKLMDLAERKKMLTETPEQLKARRDPLVDFAFALDADLRALAERYDRIDGAITRLRPEWRRAVMAHAGKPIPPDANGTLRISFAHVGGYEPRDGVTYVPQTTLAGVVEKHTGVEPFNVPARVLAAAKEKRNGQWVDPKLGDVPVAFLASADTTGGNSGSPVVNGRGELVGVNFDRVWENVSNDFGYLPEVGRNISVDIRYVLWMLDQVEGATPLLEELGVR